MTTEHSNAIEDQHNAGSETGATDSDLNALLSQFDNESERPRSAPPQQTQQRPRTSARSALEQLAPVIQYVEDERRAKQKQAFDSSVTAAVSKVKADDALKNLPDRIVKGFLYAYAEENEDFDRAFREQSRNPAAWEAALEKARTEASGLMRTVPDKSVTETVNAARAAVAGETETVPESNSGKISNDMLMGLSDAQFAALKAKLDGQRQPTR